MTISRVNSRVVQVDSLARVPSASKSRPETPRIVSELFEEGSSLLKRLVSLRVVFIVITILVLIPMAIGLIVLSINSQRQIVSQLSGQIQDSISGRMIAQFNNLFSIATNELASSTVMFQSYENISIPPDGTLFWEHPIWAPITEYLWSQIRRDPVQLNVEFDFVDGRIIGLEAGFGIPGDSYMGIYANNTSVPVTLRNANVNGSIIDTTDWSSQLFNYTNSWGGSWIFDDTRDYLTQCGESRWFDIYPAYITEAFSWVAISKFMVVCDNEGNIMGFLSYSTGLQRLVELLNSILGDLKGRIFVVDSVNQLVISSTDTRVFFPDADLTRANITNTDERWIKDTVRALDSDFSARRFTTHINNTQYFISVDDFNFGGTINWRLVQVLESKQFLGNISSYVRKSIIAAVCVCVASVLVVLLVAWVATQPLFFLTSELKKISRLDLNLEHHSTPRLFEMKILFRAFGSMYVALRSFSRFVPMQVIVNILNSEKEVTSELKMHEVTVMFQDIAGFTSMSEEMDPMLLAKLTDEYMEKMADVIVKHGGTIDKYIGDCIMSLFNTPQKVNDHPTAATSAAIECLQVLSQKNPEWKERYGRDINIRIGIHTGVVLVGNMGSIHRLNYTAIGDNVNIAARLEPINKLFDSKIIVSKAMFKTFPKNKFLTRKLAKVRVSGKQVAHSIYEVYERFDPNILQLFHIYETALKCYRKKDFYHALDHINSALDMHPNDVASQRLKKQIEITIQSGVSDDWTYIEDLLSK